MAVTPLASLIGSYATLTSHSQYVHPQHPPNKEYRDDGSRDVYDPITSCFGFAEIEHLRMVAGQRYWRETATELKAVLIVAIGDGDLVNEARESESHVHVAKGLVS